MKCPGRIAGKSVIDTARETGVATHFILWDVNGSMDQVIAWKIANLAEANNI
jgi:hypothetical protein